MLYVPTASSGKRIDASTELPSHLLIGGAASNNQHYMKSSEANDRNEKQSSHTHDGYCNTGVGLSQHLQMVEDKYEAKRKHPNHMYAKRYKEQEEIAVVSASYAVIHPGAVMVKILHTVVTDTAM